MEETLTAPRLRYHLECRGADGALKWQLDVLNTVMSVGKNDLLTQYFTGAAYTAAWYVGLITNSSFSGTAATDTMASHADWTESTVYSNSTRVALSLGAASGGSIDNSASVAAFSINGSDTLKGAFVATGSAKGSSSGTLYSAGVFAGTQTVAPGDIVDVTVTLSLT